MKYGISAGPIPFGLVYARELEAAAQARNFWPRVLYAIAWRETLREFGLTSNTIVGPPPNSGYGVLQFTPSTSGIALPPNWADVQTAGEFAIDHWLADAVDFWTGKGISGYDLIRCVAASYNSGLGGAWSAHLGGNVDADTMYGNYGADCLEQVLRMERGLAPQATYEAEFVKSFLTA